MRSNLDNAKLRSVRMMSPTHAILRYLLTGPFVIPPDGPTLYFLDPGSSDRTVYLPVITASAGQQHFINNLSATNVLNVVDSDGVAVVTIPAGASGIFSSYASGWVSHLGLGTAGLPGSAWTSQTVTAATGTGVASDSEIFCNRAGVITITLPDAEAWYLAHQFLGSYLLIKDISGAGATNNITINRAGADTIDGATSFTITSDYGGVKFRRVAAGKWGIVG